MATPQTQDNRINAKRTANALDRIDGIEQTLSAIIPQINNSFANMSRQQESQGEVLEAVVTILGQDTITATVKANRDARALATMEAEKKGLEELKANGTLAAVEVVSDKSLIVGREFNADGTIIHPGRVQVAYQRVDAQFQPQLLGKGVGITFDLPKGGKFEVLEIYEVVQKPDAPTAGAVETAPAPTEPANATAGAQ